MMALHRARTLLTSLLLVSFLLGTSEAQLQWPTLPTQWFGGESGGADNAAQSKQPQLKISLLPGNQTQLTNDQLHNIQINPADIQFVAPDLPNDLGQKIIDQLRAQLGNKPITLGELKNRNISFTADMPGVQINRTVVSNVEDTVVARRTTYKAPTTSSYVMQSYQAPPPSNPYQASYQGQYQYQMPDYSQAYSQKPAEYPSGYQPPKQQEYSKPSYAPPSPPPPMAYQAQAKPEYSVPIYTPPAKQQYTQPAPKVEYSAPPPKPNYAKPSSQEYSAPPPPPPKQQYSAPPPPKPEYPAQPKQQYSVPPTPKPEYSAPPLPKQQYSAPPPPPPKQEYTAPPSPPKQEYSSGGYPNPPTVVYQYIEVCNGKPEYSPDSTYGKLYNNLAESAVEVKSAVQGGYSQLSDVYKRLENSMSQLEQMQKTVEYYKSLVPSLSEVAQGYVDQASQAMPNYQSMEIPLYQPPVEYPKESPPYQASYQAPPSYQNQAPQYHIASNYQAGSSYQSQASGYQAESAPAYQTVSGYKQEAAPAYQTATSYEAASPSYPKEQAQYQGSGQYQSNGNYQAQSTYQQQAPSYDGNNVKISYHSVEETIKTNSSATPASYSASY